MLIDSLIALALIILSNVIVLSAICIIGTKFSKINTLCAIRIRQYFLSTLSTSIACCFLPTHVAAILFIALFFVYRKVLFINDSFHKVSDKECLYSFSQYINSAPYIFIFYCYIIKRFAVYTICFFRFFIYTRFFRFFNRI